MNFGHDVLALRIVVDGIASDDFEFANSTMATISSAHLWDENSFTEPKKVCIESFILPQCQCSRQTSFNPLSNVLAFSLHISSSCSTHCIICNASQNEMGMLFFRCACDLADSGGVRTDG